jgi:hypothetical protein
VIPNPWDIGSARYLQQLGFPALATTSAGFAFSQGLPDSEVLLTCERNLAYIADIAGARTAGHDRNLLDALERRRPDIPILIAAKAEYQRLK